MEERSMKCPILTTGNVRLGVLAALAVALMPAVVDAATLTLRNDTKGPVIVQGFSLVNRVLRQKRHVLQPGDEFKELVVPGTKLIVIADAKQPTEILCKETIHVAGADLFFAIETEEPAVVDKPKGKALPVAKAKKEQPKVKLVPIETPVAAPVKPATRPLPAPGAKPIQNR
jgi:hypothetical protein